MRTVWTSSGHARQLEIGLTNQAVRWLVFYIISVNIILKICQRFYKYSSA